MSKRILLFTSSGLLILGLVLILTASTDLSAWDFRNNLWGPAHLLVTGRSPYLIDQLFDGSNSIWFPQIIGAFFWLGWLPQASATAFWHLLNLAALGGIFALSIRQRRPAPVWLALSLGGLLLFPPFVGHMALGQISLFTVLLVLLCAEALDRPRGPLVNGLLLALALAKPQLLMLALPGLLFARDRRIGLRLALSFGFWSVLFTLPLWLMYPDWPAGIPVALERNKDWFQPSSLQALRSMIGPTPGLLTWIALVAAAFGANLFIWRRWPAPDAARASLALTVFITPYVWTWDFVLLFPALIAALFQARTRGQRILWFLGYALIWGLLIVQRSTTDMQDGYFWWLPWALGFLIVLTLLSPRIAQPPNRGGPGAAQIRERGEV